MDFQSEKSFGKLRLRAFQPYHQILCMSKHVEDVEDEFMNSTNLKKISMYSVINFSWKVLTQGIETLGGKHRKCRYIVVGTHAESETHTGKCRDCRLIHGGIVLLVKKGHPCRKLNPHRRFRKCRYMGMVGIHAGSHVEREPCGKIQGT